jgi:hypothetical protein
MKKDIDSVPVYTRDSLGLRGETDDKKRQGKIDEWTDRLATRMAATTSSYDLIHGFGLNIRRRDGRGGHNKMTIEMINSDGYLVKVYHSIADAEKHLKIDHSTIARAVHEHKRPKALMAGCILRKR